MNHPITLAELEQNRKRLAYYSQLKQQAGGKPSPADKWIEVYSERIKKTERQLQKAEKIGLKTDLKQDGLKKNASARA